MSPQYRRFAEAGKSIKIEKDKYYTLGYDKKNPSKII